MLLMLGPVDLGSLRQIDSTGTAVIEGAIASERLTAMAGRLDKALPVGNEGAGTVIDAGEGAETLLGRIVAFRATTGTFATHQLVRAVDCIVLPDGVSARAAAGAFINPLTALGMVETMRREGHSALVHTAAASNVGQMLNRLCLRDRVPLVNIVRSSEQVELLRGQGAVYALNSTSADFREALEVALRETGATLAFDAIGGGTMASTILSTMEKVASEKLTTYSRYGAPVHKQVYIYGVLDPSPRVLEGQLGTAWGVGGWLMSWFMERIGAEAAQRLRDRVAAELTTTFASHFDAEVDLTGMLSPDAIRSFSRRSTGKKQLVMPNGSVA